MTFSYDEMMRGANLGVERQQAKSYAERKTLEIALAEYGGRYVPELTAIIEAARKHLDTLPKPKTVFKVTGQMPREGRKTCTYATAGVAAEVASEWLRDGMQHVAIFRDEV